MRGVEGTAYEGGRWLLDIKIPDNYPNAPPVVRFVTRICHPNVAFEVRRFHYSTDPVARTVYIMGDTRLVWQMDSQMRSGLLIACR